MHYFSLLGLLASASVVIATAADPLLVTNGFNVTKALLDHGVDVQKLPVSAESEKRTEQGCAAACASLKILYGNSVVERWNEKAFDDFTNAYWSSIQTGVNPYCIFKPQKPTQVSVLVLLSRLAQCPFAAKSGGHAAFAGASSIEGGITVSFANFKDISLSKDRKIASIGPGNIWGSVFEELSKFDVTVIGGRVHDIGVGGLTTGGGISYFSNLHGWACDNVESYEVVLANGLIVTASATNHPDLYWALRGGGNNFGLVLKFNLKTISLPKGRLWGGMRVYTEDKFPEVTNALFNIVKNSEKDPKAGLYVVFSYNNGTKIVMPFLYYAEPGGGKVAIWDDFNKIEPIQDTTMDRDLAAWAKDMTNYSPSGLRQMYYVISTKVEREILDFARDYFFKTLHSVGDIPGILPAMVIQGITTPQIKQMQKNGGNALGISVDNGPLFIIQISVWWERKADDKAVHSWVSHVLETISQKSKARGVGNDYVYMNYASQFQNVIATYGPVNKARLESISKKYDPQQVFQLLQPGYFKLDRAPVASSDYFSH
ncbi:FAD binding domain-containing protein [Fusarium heterosporum]|uniref:FAD binding domain-containing protein n=1 Tax=Fusarium heterosporum TaxID=42747 RepID=A0A8H5TWR5_FUSHE|nr:FAD binding domain-containing protein [Fusarium heterosporum]